MFTDESFILLKSFGWWLWKSSWYPFLALSDVILAVLSLPCYSSVSKRVKSSKNKRVSWNWWTACIALLPICGSYSRVLMQNPNYEPKSKQAEIFLMVQLCLHGCQIKRFLFCRRLMQMQFSRCSKRLQIEVYWSKRLSLIKTSGYFDVILLRMSKKSRLERMKCEKCTMRVTHLSLATTTFIGRSRFCFHSNPILIEKLSTQFSCLSIVKKTCCHPSFLSVSTMTSAWTSKLSYKGMRRNWLWMSIYFLDTALRGSLELPPQPNSHSHQLNRASCKNVSLHMARVPSVPQHTNLRGQKDSVSDFNLAGVNIEK